MVYQMNDISRIICLRWIQYFSVKKMLPTGSRVLINGKIFVELMVVKWKNSINQVLACQPVDLKKQIWITPIEKPTPLLLCKPRCSSNPPVSATCQSHIRHGGVSIRGQLPQKLIGIVSIILNHYHAGNQSKNDHLRLNNSKQSS